jgi:hypothetical protein
LPATAGFTWLPLYLNGLMTENKAPVKHRLSGTQAGPFSAVNPTRINQLAMQSSNVNPSAA